MKWPSAQLPSSAPDSPADGTLTSATPLAPAASSTPGGHTGVRDGVGESVRVALCEGLPVPVALAVGVADGSSRPAGRHGSDTPLAATDAGTAV